MHRRCTGNTYKKKTWFYKAFLHGHTCSQIFLKGQLSRLVVPLPIPVPILNTDMKVCTCTHGPGLGPVLVTSWHAGLVLVPIPVGLPMVSDPGKYTHDHIYSKNKVSKKTVISFFLFFVSFVFIFVFVLFLFLFCFFNCAALNSLHCFVHGGENFWNWDKELGIFMVEYFYL